MGEGARAIFEKFIILYADLAAYLPTYEAAWERRDREIARRTGIQPHWGFRSEFEPL